ncbi:unnamed protein product [Rhodiola kirilowii]
MYTSLFSTNFVIKKTKRNTTAFIVARFDVGHQLTFSSFLTKETRSVDHFPAKDRINPVEEIACYLVSARRR